VNDILAAFADDGDFQLDLERPAVRLALACWGGRDAQGPKHTAEEVEAARADPAFARLGPLLKGGDLNGGESRSSPCVPLTSDTSYSLCPADFELLTEKAKLRFPVDHLLEGRRELTLDAVIYAHGVDFATKFFEARGAKA